MSVADAAAQLSFVTTTVDSTGNVGRSASIAVDSHGYPHIAYLQVFDISNLDLKYASLSATGWENETAEDALYWASYADLVIDATDTPGIGYTGGFANYTTRSGSGSWVPELIGDAGYGAWQVAVALDDQDVPHAVYNWSVPKYYTGINYCKRGASDWSQDEFTNSGYLPPSGSSFSLAVAPNGDVHVSLNHHFIDSLRYYNGVGGNWTADEFNAGAWSSIALDALNSPIISFYRTGPGDLVLLEKYSGMWVPVTIDAPGDVGQYSSLALDSGGTPHVVYYDATLGALKYAVRIGPGAAWQKYTIDNEGDVGQWASLAFDNNDKPHIAYYDMTNGNLKYATLDPLVPTERHSWGSIKSLLD